MQDKPEAPKRVIVVDPDEQAKTMAQNVISEAASDLPSNIKATQGAILIQQLMKKTGRRGSIKDFVVLMHRDTMVDYNRAYKVTITFPEVIEVGATVYYDGPDGVLCPATVVDPDIASTYGMLHPAMQDPEDWKDTLYISNGHSVSHVRRSEVYPSAIPMRPTLVHKRDLEGYVGPEWASRMWSKALGVRRK